MCRCDANGWRTLVVIAEGRGGRPARDTMVVLCDRCDRGRAIIDGREVAARAAEGDKRAPRVTSVATLSDAIRQQRNRASIIAVHVDEEPVPQLQHCPEAIAYLARLGIFPPYAPPSSRAA